MLTQNDIIFIQEACGHKVNEIIREIVDNANKVSALEQAAKAAAEAQAKEAAKPKTTKTKKGE